MKAVPQVQQGGGILDADESVGLRVQLDDVAARAAHDGRHRPGGVIQRKGGDRHARLNVDRQFAGAACLHPPGVNTRKIDKRTAA